MESTKNYDLIHVIAVTQYLDRINFTTKFNDLEDYEKVIIKIIDLWNTKKYVEIGYINEFLNNEEAVEEIQTLIKN